MGSQPELLVDQLKRRIEELESRLRETGTAEEQETAELLNRVGPILVRELDLHRLVQRVTDIATKLVGAEFGSFFHNVTNERGESYMLYALSGVSRDAFKGFPMPRNTAIFGPTFSGEGIVRSDDITQDVRYGKSEPHRGMPKGHLPVRSYLAAPVVSRSGEVLGGLFFGHSAQGQFTERHEAIITGVAGQAAVAMDNARLFEQAQWVQSDLKRANEELRRANRDLETFAYSASHDLQEPLRNVALSAQLLDLHAGHKLDQDQRQFLDSILYGARRMETLMQDLLTYIQAIRHADGPAPDISTEKVLSDVLETLKNRIDECGAEVTQSDLITVAMHEVHLSQLFQNLIGNALKYRRVEAPRVHISSTQEDGWAILSVQDNGIGIEPRYADQIFELFKRLHPRDEYPGSGIGLAICQRIVEQYGGRIWVEKSALGTGSVFYFAIPDRRAGR